MYVYISSLNIWQEWIFDRPIRSLSGKFCIRHRLTAARGCVTIDDRSLLIGLSVNTVAEEVDIRTRTSFFIIESIYIYVCVYIVDSQVCLFAVY